MTSQALARIFAISGAIDISATLHPQRLTKQMRTKAKQWLRLGHSGNAGGKSVKVAEYVARSCGLVLESSYNVPLMPSKPGPEREALVEKLSTLSVIDILDANKHAAKHNTSWARTAAADRREDWNELLTAARAGKRHEPSYYLKHIVNQTLVAHMQATRSPEDKAKWDAAAALLDTDTPILLESSTIER